MAMSLDQQWSEEQHPDRIPECCQFGHTVSARTACAPPAAAFFNTTPDKLTVPQSALLAGPGQQPVLYDPYKYPKQALEPAQPGDPADGG